MHELVGQLARVFCEKWDHQHKEIMSALHRVEQQQEKLMSAITDAAAKAEANFALIRTGIANLDSQVVALQQQIANGSNPDPADLAAVNQLAADSATLAAAAQAPVTAPPTVPVAPANLAADSTTTPGSVALTFGASPGATSYNIKRGTSAGSESTIGTSPTNSFTDTVSPGQGTLFYVVTAVNAAGESPASNEVSVTV
jgi:hypothetical protein